MRENSRGGCGVACSSEKHPVSAVTSKMFCPKGFAWAMMAGLPSTAWVWVLPELLNQRGSLRSWPGISGLALCTQPSLGEATEISINTSKWRSCSELWNEQVLRLEFRIEMQSSPRPLLMRCLCRLDCSARILFAEDKYCCGQHSIHPRWMLFCQCTSTQLGREMETAAWRQPGT